MIPIFDGHNDTLLALWQHPERDFFTRNQTGHVDLPRAREGGLAGGLFAVFPSSRVAPNALERAAVATDGSRRPPPQPPLPPTEATWPAMAMTAELFRLEAASQGQLKVVTDTAGLERCLREGIFAAVLHFEGAEAIDPELHALEVYYRAGLRSLGLVWSRPNAFGNGVPFSFPGSPDVGVGLTAAGHELVAACNRLGILLDLSHLNERGFWEVAERSSAPLVATHSNAHALCPSPRNLSDQQLEAVRVSDGMVGLNFAVTFLREDGRRNPDTPVETMIRHLDYLIERLGSDRVGFGSDFDGAMVPAAIGDASGLPRLLAALENHGYDHDALEKLAFRNWLRVLARTWQG